jgi:hypothetical protein
LGRQQLKASLPNKIAGANPSVPGVLTRMEQKGLLSGLPFDQQHSRTWLCCLFYAAQQ